MVQGLVSLEEVSVATIKIFDIKNSGAYIQAYKRDKENWKFDLNFFNGDRTEKQLRDLKRLIEESLEYVSNENVKDGK